MAATILRDAYDCIVLGSGRTASQVAAAIARTGRQTLQLTRESSPPPSWLHPRFSAPPEVESLPRLPLSSVSAVNAAGKTLATVSAANWSAARTSSTTTPAITTFELPAGCRAACESDAVHLNGALPPTVIRSTAVIKIERAPNLPPLPVVGGVYRGVANSAAGERQATLFATRRGGEVCWLVPLAGGLWNLGVMRSAEAQTAYSQQQTVAPSTQSAEESPAHWLEEALVACPSLTQRLIAAELVGELHSTTLPSETKPGETPPVAITLPAYDDWLDPVFASGDWLGHELAQQLIAQFPSANDASQRLAEWQATWPAVEQLTRERIAPWYQLDATLPAALHDHAQREWYEKLLSA
jgi:hypothetical protein